MKSSYPGKDMGLGNVPALGLVCVMGELGAEDIVQRDILMFWKDHSGSSWEQTT